MITYIIPYRDCLINERQPFVIPFLERMQLLMEENRMCSTVICDNGSQDNIEEVVSKYNRINYLYVEPNETQFLNLSKCFNKATILSKNPLVGTLGVDFIVPAEALRYTIDFFRALGRIILRPELLYYNKEGKVHKRFNVPYIVHREDVLKIGGWDERMYNWGKEEDDLILRLRTATGILEVLVKGFGYVHLWHDRNFSEAEEIEQGHNWEIMKDNIRNRGKNVLNSYWRIEQNEQGNFVIKAN
jgi:predicted glycosyltransferase involved in capsule biosynthesis